MKKERNSFTKSEWINAPTAEERAAMVSKIPKHVYVKKKKTKKQLDEEELAAMQACIEQEQKPPEPEPEPVKVEKEWDVPKTEKIKYFDPSLSYELTGYRPIDKEHGLDFDPKAFTGPADHYRKFGKYTDYFPDTYKWQQYWTSEIDKCTHGVTIGKYTLTGMNYFFLNYYRLLSPVSADRSGAQRSEDFPIFVNKQYEYFHYLELCKKAGFDGLAFKSRGVGASEIAASNCAHAFTFVKQSNNVVTSFLEKYVRDTLSKVWQELDFLDSCTEGAMGWHKQKTNTLMKKVASTIDADTGIESGWRSCVEGITADNPDKLRGGRTENLYFEEAGNNPCLIETYLRGEPLVSIVGKRIGNRFVFGTSQKMGPAVEGLKTMFYNPTGYHILPYYNTHMANGEPRLTGYFIPSYTMWFGNDEGTVGYDERGVVNEEKAREYYLNQWALIEDAQALLIAKSEYCFTPEDAFVMEGDNRFDREKLAEQLANLEVHKIIEKPKKAKLLWNIRDGECDRTQRPQIIFDSSGKIDIAEVPLCDDMGVPFKNLYVIGLDSIDSDASTSTGQTDVSQFALIVLRRGYGLQPPKIVAAYKDRPKDIKTAFDNALKLCKFYNCQMLVEATRISIKQHFERYGAMSYLMHRPRATANTTTKTNYKQYGVPATVSIIDHQLDLIEQFISDYCETIQFSDIIDELLRYSFANKRKFDYVAALGMALLADEEMINRVVKTESRSKLLGNVGYYRDEYGRVSYGEIKKQTTNSSMLYGWTRKTNY